VLLIDLVADQSITDVLAGAPPGSYLVAPKPIAAEVWEGLTKQGQTSLLNRAMRYMESGIDPGPSGPWG
jgi:hypothetical protein